VKEKYTHGSFGAPNLFKTRQGKEECVLYHFTCSGYTTYLAEMVINFQMRVQLLDPDLHCDYPARFDHLPDVYPIIHRSVQLVVRVNFVVVTAAASLIVGFAIINKIVLLPKTNLYTVVSPADYKTDKIK
jgi:hypothetical protein